MDYAGTSFNAMWGDGVLCIEAFALEDNSFGLMEIILDAAIEQDSFNIAWDLRNMEPPSFYQIWKMVSFASQMQPKLSGFVNKASVLITPKYEKTIRFIMKYTGPSCPCYVGTNAQDAKNFVL